MGGNEEEKVDAVYKTKAVNFLGRSVPIILQNDNGPCPLIAICNVLLLRNNVSLRKEASEISLQNLLTLVAERLLDSNSNNENKDENYIQNQQQNISDAISLLPRLATGIDVNVRFRNIHDFEFTPECAIFDLLDIDLVHGWLCDPQDENTSKAVGSNSYNVLVEKLVALHSTKADVQEEPTIDFAAATTASLGVPSPGLCARKSFENLQFPDFSEKKGDEENNVHSLESSSAGEENGSDVKKKRKGDEEEAAQLLNALNLSRVEGPPEASGKVPEASSDTEISPSSVLEEPQSTTKDQVQAGEAGSTLKEWPSLEVWVSGKEGEGAEENGWHMKTDRDTESSPTSIQVSTSSEFECLEVDECRAADSSNVSVVEVDKMESATADSVVDPCEEPLYEGETTYHSFEGDGFEDREPLYEGEAVVLDEQPTSSGSEDDASLRSPETEALIIENFLSNHASQLTYYGLFSLQEGLKERELCVFFRNNHFSTMFKYQGDLFLLVTDQGYLNEPDLVWEKLTEVDGDSVFYTGNFTLFKVDEQTSSSSWNEREAVAATADFISSQIGKSAPTEQHTGDGSYNSDLQLAMALQQQEFDQQQNQQNQQNQQHQQPQQQIQQQQQQQIQQHHQQQSPRKHSNSPRKGSRPSSGISPGRLFTGPSSSPPPKSSEAKSKEKCRVM